MLEIIESLHGEVLRLRIRCKDLQDQLDKLLVNQARRADDVGEFERIVQEINEREERDRGSALALIK